MLKGEHKNACFQHLYTTLVFLLFPYILPGPEAMLGL